MIVTAGSQQDDGREIAGRSEARERENAQERMNTEFPNLYPENRGGLQDELAAGWLNGFKWGAILGGLAGVTAAAVVAYYL